VVWLRRQQHSELQELDKVERSECGPCKASARVCSNSEVTSHSTAPKAQQLTNPEEVQEAIRGLRVVKAPSPDKALKRLPQRAVSLLFLILTLSSSPITFLQRGNTLELSLASNPALPLSYRPISLLETIGKLFENILLATVLLEVKVRGLMRDKEFGLRPKHTTSLQLARLVERITRNFGENILKGAIFLDVAKAFDTV
jgi:hypothetical protein